MAKLCSEKPLTIVCVRLGPKKGEIWQEILYFHESKALHHPELSLCQKGKKGPTLTSQQWCKQVSWVLCLVTHITLCELGDKLNFYSFVLFWLSCWTVNLNIFLSKLTMFLSHKHLSHPLCSLISPQFCLFFYRGGGHLVGAKIHQLGVYILPVGFCTQSHTKALFLKITSLCVKRSFFLCVTSYE